MEGYSFNTLKLINNAASGSKLVALIAAGCFNPITHMHLRLFERGRDHMQSLGYHVVGGFISPAADSYGKKGLIPSHHRITMCEAAASGSSWIAVDTWEARQPKYTPTLFVLEHFAQHMPGVTPMLLCGGDLVESFTVPGVWAPEHVEDILSKFGVICLERSSTNLAAIIDKSPVLSKNAKNIFRYEDVPNAISSTSIREYVSKGMSVKYLVPDAVIEYIAKNNLYKA